MPAAREFERAQIGCPFSAGDKSKRGLRSRSFENSARHGVMRFVTQ